MSRWHLSQAVHYLDIGGTVAYPTEAIFGLGCDPFNLAAVDNLLYVKQRSWRKGLIVIGADLSHVTPLLAPLPLEWEQKILSTQAVITWVLPANPSVSELVRGVHDTLAVRIIRHPLAAALCHCFGGALVSTSANISRHPPARNALQVRKIFGNQIDYILTGATGGRKLPSQIRDIATDKILR